MNFSTGQRLAGPYSAPGFNRKSACEIFSRPNFFFAASISSGVTNNCGAQRFRVRAERGSQMQILVDLVRGLRGIPASEFWLPSLAE